jgi:hypothetical protein
MEVKNTDFENHALGWCKTPGELFPLPKPPFECVNLRGPDRYTPKYLEAHNYDEFSILDSFVYIIWIETGFYRPIMFVSLFGLLTIFWYLITPTIESYSKKENILEHKKINDKIYRFNIIMSKMNAILEDVSQEMEYKR